MTILLLICLIIFAIVLQKLTLAHGLDNVTYDLQIPERVVECDQLFPITTIVQNKKIMPVFYLRIMENYPKDINLDVSGTNVVVHDFTGLNKPTVEIRQTTYLMPKQKMTRTLEGSLPKRGLHTFSNVTFVGGDLLGIEEHSEQVYNSYNMIALPKRIEAPELTNTFGNYLGDMSVRRFILEDPVLTLSFREYTGREPMKDISWPRSMRDGKLMVKQYDYTQELTATVILDGEFSKGFDSDTFEKALSLTRGICEQLEQKKIPYSYSTNVISAGINNAVTATGTGMGRLHLMAILESLGCASEHTSKSFSRLMDSVITRAESGRAHIIITPDVEGDKMDIIRKAESVIGSPIFIVNASEAPKEDTE